MENKTPYPTDEFGRPDGRNYHYRIPLNDDKAMKLASLALKEIHPFNDRFVTEWDEYSGDSLSYMGIQTHDNKGHLTGLAEYAHSPRWQDVGPMTDIDEYRNGRDGGTKIRGSFRVDPQSFNGATKLSFETVISQTPTELEAALDERDDMWRDIQQSIRYAKDDAVGQAHEQIAQQQRECEHPIVVEGTVTHHCEQCGAELTENGDLRH